MNEERTLVLPRRNEMPDFGNGSIFFIGTATVVLRYAGFTILTDPNFLHRGDHVHLGYGLTSRRQTNPAVEIEDLPPWTSSCCRTCTGITSSASRSRSSTRRPRSSPPLTPSPTSREGDLLRRKP